MTKRSSYRQREIRSPAARSKELRATAYRDSWTCWSLSFNRIELLRHDPVVNVHLSSVRSTPECANPGRIISVVTQDLQRPSGEKNESQGREGLELSTGVAGLARSATCMDHILITAALPRLPTARCEKTHRRRLRV